MKINVLLPAILSVYLVLILGGCGPNAIEVLVRVKNLTPDVAALKISAELDGSPAPAGAEFTDQLDQFGIRLPLAPRSQGALHLSVHGLASDRCKLSEGQLDIKLSLDTSYMEVELDLSTLPNKLCTLTVEVLGDGKVDSIPLRLSCSGGTCAADFPANTQVTLSPQYGLTAYACEWQSTKPDCSGRDGCKVDLSSPVTVKARFVKRVCSQSGFCKVALPAAVQTNSLQTVWGSGPSDVFCAGDSGVIVHYDGNQWSFIENPIKLKINALWGRGATDIFAAGVSGLLLHYDGSRWTPEAGSGSLTVQNLAGLWGNMDTAWAAGLSGSLLHRDGSGWQVTPLSGLGPAGADFTALWGSGTTDIWAVGLGGAIFHYDGQAWRPYSPTAPPTQESLYGLWGSGPSDIWTVGTNGTRLHFDGALWQATNDGVSINNLYGVWGSGPQDVWAVGQGGTILHFDGGNWSRKSLMSPLSSALFLAVWGANPWEVWVAANGGVLAGYQP